MFFNQFAATINPLLVQASTSARMPSLYWAVKHRRGFVAFTPRSGTAWYDRVIGNQVAGQWYILCHR